MFGIGFGELDAVVRVLHGVAPANGALVARFKYMQRMGFPEGVGSGRGVRSVYGLEDLLKILLAFELLETGATPTRVVRVIRTCWSDLGQALALGWLAARDAGTRPRRLMLWAMPGAFRELGEPEDDRASVAEPLRPIPVADVVAWMHASEVELPNEASDIDPADGPRRLVIDPMRLAASLRAIVPKVTAMELEDLDRAYARLGEDAFQGAPEAAWADAAGGTIADAPRRGRPARP